MVPLQHFDKILFKQPRFYPQKPLDNLVGIDSEAYRDGTTFMFCTSAGESIRPTELFDVIFSPKYEGSNFVTWNLKYESGAILKMLPRKELKELQAHHKTIFMYGKRKFHIKYVPHKCLIFRESKFAGRTTRFWDISPFYGRIKLNTAAKTYLEKEKDDVDPNLFTPEYVDKNYAMIEHYCIQDAILTKDLADLWIKKFSATKVPVTSLYSEASISFAYFSQHTEIVTPYEFWENNRTLLRYAFESYEGGKFLITQRGSFSGYEYDISSAYPAEIADLVDIRHADVIYSKKYCYEAMYGFLRVRVSFSDPDIHLPCGIFKKLRLYPMGTYFLTITKQEYDYITTKLPSVSVDIISAAWLIVDRRIYPYRDIVNELYELKSQYKKTDPLRSKNYKIILNGFYGKLAQCLETETGTYTAGQGWNPIYASVITANTRIAVTRLQNYLGPNCIAVHTDSIMSTVPIPNECIGSGLGAFELVESGPIVLVACGIYEINGQCALKGFRKNSITKILAENPDKTKITLKYLHVESWLQAMAQNHDISNINLFSTLPKILRLNCDTKREWPDNMTSTQFLTTRQKSSPLIEKMDSYPAYWKE